MLWGGAEAEAFCINQCTGNKLKGLNAKEDLGRSRVEAKRTGERRRGNGCDDVKSTVLSQRNLGH